MQSPDGTKCRSVCIFPKSPCSCLPLEKDWPRMPGYRETHIMLGSILFLAAAFLSSSSSEYLFVPLCTRSHVLVIGLLSHGKWKCCDVRGKEPLLLPFLVLRLVWDPPAGSPCGTQREAILYHKEDARWMQAQIQLLFLCVQTGDPFLHLLSSAELSQLLCCHPGQGAGWETPAVFPHPLCLLFWTSP